MTRVLRIVMLAGAAAGASVALASSQLAGDLGCYSCHGSPPRRNVPSFQELAQRYQADRGKPDAVKTLAQRLRSGSLFSHIAAHERLTEAQAEAMARWLLDGAR